MARKGVQLPSAEDLPAAEPEARKASLVDRWGGDKRILSEGFVGVPTAFLTGFGQISPGTLTPAEAVFVLQLMVFKWDTKSPYPSYAKLADRMGVSIAYARKLARQLGRKGYLRRTVRKGETNEFDLSPLFARFADYAEAETKKRKARKRSAG